MKPRYNIFVSSTFEDLKKERKYLYDAISRLKCVPTGMELIPASNNTQWHEVTEEIDDCDFYVVVVAGRYGSVDKDGVSFTEREYDYALSKSKPIFTFLHKNTNKLKGEKLEASEDGKAKLASFRKKVQESKYCDYWDSKEELATKVVTCLANEFSRQNNPKKVGVLPPFPTSPSHWIDHVAEDSGLQNEKSVEPAGIGHSGLDQSSILAKPIRTVAREQVPRKQFSNSRIPEYFIDDLKNRADLVRIIEPYAPLKKKGSNWMGCCPFHQEKTPSFSVSPTKGFYKCFGCGKGGNAYTFLMEMEGLNFPEAIQRVAEISGVPLPEPIDDQQYAQSKKKKEEKKKIADEVIELNRIALDYWEAELQSKDKKAKAAREYLETRGISQETQKAFHIGFAPDTWDSLLNRLKEMRAGEKLIEQSGLVSINEEKDRVFDRFRGRIMFPVLDVSGNPVAFGARAMGDDQPKYLNSPETPAYIKGQHLYGLFQAKEEIRKKKFVILVEGYLDLIALYQFGITNTAASLGTAFTAEQSKLLGRYAKKIVINYDGDNAGVKAARKAVEALLAEDFDVKVLVLPDGNDPDDFIRANGADGYNDARGKAQPYLQFVLEASMSGRNLNVARQKADAIEDVLPVLTIPANPVQKRESFDQAMNFFRIEDSGLKRELWNAVKHGNKVETETLKKQVKRVTQVKMTVAEQHLLELLVYDPELQEKILVQLEETDYESLATAPIFRALYELQSKKLMVSNDNLMELVGDDEAAGDFVPLLLMTEPKREAGEVIDEVLHDAENCIFTLRSMAISNRIMEISQELIAAEQSGNTDLVNHFSAEQLDLERLKRALLKKIADN